MMDPVGSMFGRGPRECTGALDLISHYKLMPHHEFFCKKSCPVLVLETHYLYNVVGDTDIRKGEGMQLNQLVQNTFSGKTNACIRPFNLDVLGEAFRLRESASIYLPPSEKGIPTVAVKSSESKPRKIIENTGTKTVRKIKGSTDTNINVKRGRRKRKIKIIRKGSVMQVKMSMALRNRRKVRIRGSKIDEGGVKMLAA